jgi:heterodisulfide reductase subunit C
MKMAEEEYPKYPLEKPSKIIPQAFKGVAVNIISQAQIQNLISFWTNKRKSLGLSEKPLTAYSSEKAVMETQELVEATRFDRSSNIEVRRKKPADVKAPK